MNYIIKWILCVNPILIIFALLIVPFFTDSLLHCNFDNIEWNSVCLNNKSDWTMVMYIVPIIGANLIMVFYLVLFVKNFETKTNSDDPYEGYTDGWRKFLEDEDKRKLQNKIESDAILQKYDSMPDLEHHPFTGVSK